MEDANGLSKKKNKKRDKLRAAWIAFAGRIVAQLVGAIATVALGAMVLHRYTVPPSLPPPATEVALPYADPAAPAPCRDAETAKVNLETKN